MFNVRFNYYGKETVIRDCYGVSLSPAGRNMYVKVKKFDGKFTTQAYYASGVRGLNVTYVGKAFVIRRGYACR